MGKRMVVDYGGRGALGVGNSLHGGHGDHPLRPWGVALMLFCGAPWWGMVRGDDGRCRMLCKVQFFFLCSGCIVRSRK